MSRTSAASEKGDWKVKQNMRQNALATLIAVCVSIAFCSAQTASSNADAVPVNHGKVNARLFVGEGEKQPLLVGFGGAEGRNAWASNTWKPQRDRFLAQGYAVLGIAYFGEAGIPAKVDRISLDGVHAAIADAAKNPKINSKCVALIGGSKGAELALLLASHYPDIKAVVGIVAGSAVFAGHTDTMDTSSFSMHGQQLPFVPVPANAVPHLIKGQLRPAWDEMVKDKDAMEKAAIHVERINGPVFLLSATQDEYWPSKEMSDAIIARLKKSEFRFNAEHVAIEGKHGAPLKHMNLVEGFLQKNFLAESSTDCPR
jgi:poly(3-hydroxybutyrate) depolymerase